MRRRRFIELTAATAIAGSASANAGYNSASTISRLRFHSTGSFYGADGGPLTDGAYVPVWAEDTASNDGADYDSNLNGDETVPVTSNVDRAFDLFGPYT